MALVQSVNSSLATGPVAIRRRVATGIDATVLNTVNGNASLDVAPLSDDFIASQQVTADPLFGLGLIPRAVVVCDIVRKAAD